MATTLAFDVALAGANWQAVTNKAGSERGWSALRAVAERGELPRWP